jgi:serine phosphatase RsbU (regulator of sigma subunit)
VSKRIAALLAKLGDVSLEPTERVDILNEIARQLAREDLEKAGQFADEAFELAQKHQYEKGLIYDRLNRGAFCFFQSEIETATSCFLETLDWGEKNHDKQMQADSRSFLGLIYWSFGDFTRGFEFVTNALALNREIREQDRQAWNLNTLGGFHYDLKDYEKSIEHFKKAYPLFRQEQDSGGQARALNGIGNNCHLMGFNEQALAYQKKSLKVLQTTQNDLTRSKTLNDTGLIYKDMGKYEQAWEYLSQSLRIRKEIGYSTGETTTLLDLGNLLIAQNESDQALEVINQALELSRKIKAKPKIGRAYKSLAEIYEKRGELDKAFQNFRAFHEVDKEVYREDADKRLRHMEVVYELERSKKLSEMLYKELSLARKLQKNILPVTLPEINGLTFAAKYLPAMEIGGDFYDVMPLTKDRLAVLISDVTGHGIQAALSTTLLKFAFRTFQNCDVSPAEILAGMNDTLYKTLTDETFVAALVVIVDTATAHCTLVNGGIPHPVIFNKDTKKVSRIVAGGLVLGAVGAKLYKPGEQVDLILESGELLLLFTDGLSEMEGHGGQEFDAGRMGDTILRNYQRPPGELVEHLAEAAIEFGGMKRQRDDITIVCISHD